MSVLKTEAFTGTDGTLLNTYDANWVVQVGADGELKTNVLANNTTGRAFVRYHGVTWPNDQYAQATIVAVAANNQAVCVRCGVGGGALTYYGAGHNNNEYGHKRYSLWKYSGGAFTNLGSHASQLVTIGDIVKLTVVGTTLTVYVDSGSGLVDIGIGNTDATLGSGDAGIDLWHGTASVAMLDTFVGGDFTSVSSFSKPMWPMSYF